MKRLLFITTVLIAFCLSASAQKATYNFNDGSWGEPTTERPESGSFDNKTVKDVKFENASLYQKEGKGTIRVFLDKKSTKSCITLPEFAGAKEIVIDASIGSEDKTMKVEERVGKKWNVIEEPVLTKQKATYTLKLSEGATQVRISNPTTSGLYVYKVVIQ